MVKIIFFDVGGVLIWDDAELILRRQSARLRVPLEELLEYMRPDRLLLTKGTITRHEYLRRLSQRFGAKPIRIRDLVGIVPNQYRRYPAVWMIARRLRAKGYLIGVITNASPPFPFGPRLRLSPLFRPVIRSYEVGSAKPERKIFDIARRRAKIPFRSIIFFDDRPRNVAAARKLGINAFVYRNHRQLARELKERGVKI